MGRKVVAASGLILALVVVSLLVWPVQVKPVSWQASAAPGYVGPFAPNDRLKGLEVLPIGGNHGPETVALDADGRIYAVIHEGHIVRLRADGSDPENWVTSGGRPLGIRFDPAGHLLVADAFRGLLHDLTSHLRREINGIMQSFSTEGVGEAIRAFGEKRRLVFRGK